MIIPWQVDVPQDKWPVANWLIMAACFIVAFFQIRDLAEGGPGNITETLALQGWGLKGLLGYMWLHGGFWHLLGNMWFLWIFGNAVCANIGNLRYAPVYVALGVAAGMAHLIASPYSAIGASGAINGIVGMYLVMFPQNEITCYFWFFLVYVRQFTVSSYWLILFWLFWDILGALKWGSSGVAHFAHLGGFAAGVGLGVLFCKKGWCLLDEYDRSLVQIWQDRRKTKENRSFDATNIQPGDSIEDLKSAREIPIPPRPVVPMLDLAHGTPTPAVLVRSGPGTPTEAALTPQRQTIRFACSCGKKIKVSARYAGRFGKCPRCGARLRIPFGREGRIDRLPPHRKGNGDNR